MKKILLTLLMLIGCQVWSNAAILLYEPFNNPTLPAGWANAAMQGSALWTFRNAPVFSSASAGNYAVFDDQALGAGVTPNEAFLRTPSVNCTGHTAVYLSFSHHWFGVEFTHGYVEVSNDGGGSWNTLIDYHMLTRGSLGSPQDTVFNITAFAANQADVRVRFRYTDGGQAGRFWYIDDVRIFSDPDVGVTALVDPPYLACAQTYNAAQTVTVTITNFGVNPVSNIPVVCNVTGGTTATLNGIFPGPLAGGASANFTFAATIDMSLDAVYNFNIATTLAGDEYIANDAHYDSRQQRVITYPYIQNFDATTAGWRATGQLPPLNGGRNFVHGILPYLNGPQGNGDSWYVQTTQTNNGTFIWVESPVFDFSALSNPQFSMDIKHALHPSDYFRVDYSINGGTTWVQLGNSTTSPLWYNTTNWWSSTHTAPLNQWTKVFHNLCMLAGQSCVKFRVYGRPFYSEPTYINHHYFVFDNVEIKDGPDVGVTAYIDPVDVGCLFGTTQQVTVRVNNFSCGPVSNIPITCEITGAITQTLTATVPGPIPVGANVVFTFPTTFNMTGIGNYNFNTFTQMPADAVNNNDTLATSINVTNLKVTTYPYFEDFNSGAGFWNASGQAPPLNGGRNFVLGALPYLGGPNGNGDSWYVETTSTNNGTFIWVESPVFDFSNLTNPKMSFDIKQALHPSDYFQVQFSINGGTTWSQLGSGISPTWYNTTNWWSSTHTAPVNVWTHMEQDLCNLSGEPCVKFRFYGRPFYSEPTYVNHHYFAFDNFRIDQGEDDDIEPVEIILSNSGTCAPFSATETISVIIKNNTCRPLFNVPVDLQLNGGPIISEIIPGPIPRFGDFIYTFSNTLDLSLAGAHNITVTTNLPTDSFPGNDSRTENRFSSNRINIFPHLQNFDADNGAWVSRTAISHRYFHWDTLTYLNGPQGNGKSWFVETSQTNNGTFIWVESPVFDFSTLSSPQLTMDIKHALHPSDYFHLEYSINGGTTWTQLGTSVDPNWYNTTNWWSSSHTTPLNQWTKVQHNLCVLAGQSCVKFRIYGRPYYSEPTYTNHHYFAFDNFEIKDGPDVGIIAYIDPVDNGCLFATNQNVTVRVYNWTCSPISNVPVQCDVTGQIIATLTGTVPGPIPVGGFVNYTFPSTLNMTAVGTYNFNSYTLLPGDVNPWNDDFQVSINVVGLKVTTFPYFEDFNSGAAYWFAGGQAPPLNNGRNFVLAALPYLGGPNGNGDSWYVETTSTNNGTFIWVESPVFDFSNLTNPKMSFDIKQALHPSDYFQVQFSINGGTTWSQLGSGISPTWYNTTNWWSSTHTAPVSVWTHMEQDLCTLSGEPCVKFRFYGRPFYSEPTYINHHYFAFDNFRIDAGNPDDMEPVEIILSNSSTCAPFSVNETVAVLVKNNTCRPLYNIPVDLQLNGGPIISEIIPGPIPRFGDFIYTFSNTLDLSPAGIHNITVTTRLSTDSFPANDSRTENRFSSVPIATFPYFEDFEADNGGWVSRTAISHRYFHWDTLTYLNGPQGNGKSWFVETSQTNNGTFIWVESPIFNLSGLSNPQLSMDIKHALHPSDYFHVEYSTNGGTTWTQLGNSSSPGWYNTTNWWSSSHTAPVNSWTRVQHSLCALVGQSCVKFRIYGRPFYSEPTYTNHHYFAFDNFEINDGVDVGVIAYTAPLNTGCLYSDTQAVSVRVYNFGCGPVTNIPVSCDVSGILNTTLTGIVPGPIPVGGSVVYTFPATVDMTPIGTYNFTAYTTSGTDANNANDTTVSTLLVEQIKISSFPYYEDFNSGNGYWLARGQSPPLNGGRNFVLGALPYLNGPEGFGDSWYVETTSTNNGTFIWVESPVFDFTNVTNPKLHMDIKYALHPSDYFHVEYSINGGTTWVQLGNGSSPYWYNTTNWWTSTHTAPVNRWTHVEHTLCNLIGQSCVKFRVYGRPFYSEPTYINHHYFAFDNVHITDTPLDAEVNFVQGCFGSPYDLEVTVINNSRQCITLPTITSIDLTYSINGAAPVTQTFTGLNIAFGSSQVIPIAGATVPNNGSSVVVWCSNPNGLFDHVYKNDTAYGNPMAWPDCNDHCSNATVLGLGTTTASQTSNATPDTGEDPDYAACGFMTVENTVWYQFTTNSSGDSVTVIFENQICAPSQNGIQISIDRPSVACDPSTYSNQFCAATGDTNTVVWGPNTLMPNTTYYIAIDGFAGSDCLFDIRILGAVDPIILPLELLGFKAECSLAGNAVDLSWQTANEENIDFYTIERSYDAINYEMLSLLDANNQEFNVYNFRDFSMIQGLDVYYRVKQTDLQKNETLSPIKSVICGQILDGFNLYPNPNKGQFNLRVAAMPGDDWTLEIYNTLGQIVFEKSEKAASNSIFEQLSLTALSSGSYWVKMTVADKLFSEKLIITHD
jgi:hypothetical protein